MQPSRRHAASAAGHRGHPLPRPAPAPRGKPGVDNQPPCRPVQPIRGALLVEAVRLQLRRANQ
eukprot:7031966-Pyramimonas_sp.AAC.1